MKTRIGVLGLLLVGACGGDGAFKLYDNNDLELVTSYTAKEACSCLFVMEQDEAFCRAWVAASPAVAEFTVDTEAKVVKSNALLMWDAKARFVDDRTGCRLE